MQLVKSSTVNESALSGLQFSAPLLATKYFWLLVLKPGGVCC